jgi:hypothetical protein
MGLFDFFGKKNEFNITFRKDEKLFLKDVLVGDKVRLWKREDEISINYYDKAIDEKIGFKNSKKIAKFIDEKKEYVAFVRKISGFDFTVKIIFEWDNVDLKSIIVPLPRSYEKLDKERHERRENRFEEIRRVVEEERALVQSEYDKVLLKHQTRFDDFKKQLLDLKEVFNQTKLDKLKIAIEKEIEKVESKYDKREETFWDRTEKWQESKKGQLYEGINDDLSSIQYDLESLLEDDIPDLLKNRE